MIRDICAGSRRYIRQRKQIKSRDIVLLKGAKGDRTGGLPVVYAVGLHDIEESLLAHTVLFLNKKRRKRTFPHVFFINGKLPFFVLSSTLRINILKQFREPKKTVLFPGKLGYRDSDHQRTKKAAINFCRRQNPDGGSKPLIPHAELELFINIVKCFLVLNILKLFWFGLVWFGYLEELMLWVGAGNIPPYHLK
jgi:hypothetical protein